MSTDKRKIRVSEVMIGDVRSIDGLATVSDAAALMRRHSITSLVVNRRDADDEAGLIDIQGIAREVIARNRAPDRVHVYEVMTKPVVSLPATMLVRYAVRHLTALGLRRALVVDQERNVIGIVALRDMVLAWIAD
ncbi:MAG: CBS domain-containing protein [Gammaproteobacteria bacterium]|nr:CBS domain-containing protein [Gammaproteobacteria bacterium]MCY3939532.1 CBS domain-containing protein [Gammaproteobacteria bacterium]MCY3988084.1 CBS domain-containing protein [Gammaproteobacteria bacterium]MDE0245900.1 CBS domain-containing protein [Gammaproteobacteria bacterium]